MDLVLYNGLVFSIRKFNLIERGRSIIKREDNNITIAFYFSGLECSDTYMSDMKSHEICFTFPQQYLDNYFSRHKQDFKNQFVEYEEQDLCCNKQMILHEIMNNKLQGAYREMFLESKALGLLLSFRKCNKPQSDCASCKFLMKPLEKDKIIKAKKILLSRLTNPPTIPELSLQIGINQCYLKKGFKEVFGTTVYDFVQEQRMLKAKLLLTTTAFSVSQVADEIGFSSISNFSTAFKKHTGVFPSELQKANM